MSDTIEQRAHAVTLALVRLNRDASSFAEQQLRTHELIASSLRTERRLVLEQVRAMLDRAIAELPNEPDKPTESIAETFSKASLERLKP